MLIFLSMRFLMCYVNENFIVVMLRSENSPIFFCEKPFSFQKETLGLSHPSLTDNR